MAHKYYIDTEFLEGTQKENFPISLFRKNTPPTIDLISIGIVSEDEREYYAISKDFNLKEAWNRFDIKQHSGDRRNQGDGTYKEYWIRENVLKPIFEELISKWSEMEYKAIQLRTTTGYDPSMKFNYKSLKRLISIFGKTNKQIAEEIISFTTTYSENKDEIWDEPEFYAYYADYDWVAFCWLFGKMMDLPDSFPMYCKDLKQTLDEIVENKNWDYHKDILLSMNNEKDRPASFKEKLEKVKTHYDYPTQENEHSAIFDARWNKKLHEFLNSL